MLLSGCHKQTKRLLSLLAQPQPHKHFVLQVISEPRVFGSVFASGPVLEKKNEKKTGRELIGAPSHDFNWRKSGLVWRGSRYARALLQEIRGVAFFEKKKSVRSNSSLKTSGILSWFRKKEQKRLLISFSPLVVNERKQQVHK